MTSEMPPFSRLRCPHCHKASPSPVPNGTKGGDQKLGYGRFDTERRDVAAADGLSTRVRKTLEATDHVHFYTGDSISEKAREAGFTVTEVEHIGWGPPDFRLDGKWRQHKFVDDLFEFVGRAVLLRQASSLYVIASKS